jgi:hypothetical protein
MGKIIYCPRFLERGLLCATKEGDEGSLLLQIYQFRNLYHRRNESALCTGVRISGESLLILASLNDTLSEGVMPFVVEGTRESLQTEATVIRVDPELIIALPHTLMAHEDIDLIFGEGENADIYTANKRVAVGRTLERFLYAAGAEQSWGFFNAKEKMMEAIGIPQANTYAWRESLSLEEAFQYNLKLAQAVDAQEPAKEKATKKEVFTNPLLHSSFTLKRRKN